MVFSEMQATETAAAISLWEKCKLTRSWNDPTRDIEFALAGETSTVIIGKIDELMVATAMLGHDGHRGTFYYVAVDPAFQKHGYGAALIKFCENWLKQRGVWKINIHIRKDNISAVQFYETVGFEMNDVVSMGKKI